MAKTVVDIEIPIKCSTAKGIVSRTGCAINTMFGWMMVFEPAMIKVLKGIGWCFFYVGMALDLLFPMFFFAFLLAGSASIAFIPEHYVESNGYLELAFMRVLGLFSMGMFTTMIIVWATMRYNVDLKIHCIKDKLKE
jgi:hypothetical protein